MAMGMSKEEYWNGDIFSPLAYIEADGIRRRRMNEEAWIQGLYIYDAFSAAIARHFAGDNEASYPTEPYDIFHDKKVNQEEETEKQKLFAESYMKRFYEWGKQLEGK